MIVVKDIVQLRSAIILCFLFLIPFINSGQQGIKLQLSYSDSATSNSKQFPNEKEISAYLNEKQMDAFKNGYLAYSVDSITQKDSIHQTAWITTGKPYQWGEIKWDVNDELLLKSGLDPQKLENKKASPETLLLYYEKLIQYYENNGYPFASVQLTEVKIDGHTFSGSLKVKANEMHSYDTIAVHGSSKIRNSYLQHYLSIVQNEPYNELNFQSISKKLKELPFAILEQKPAVEFINNKAIVHLYLKKKSANFFNGIIGILPNSPQLETVNDKSNLLITGDIKLILINSLKSGEKFNLTWKSLKPGTQSLNAGVAFPYLFNTDFGVDDQFSLLKQDSSFVNTSNQLGIIYSLSSNKRIKVFWENSGTNVLNDKINNGDLIGNSSNSYGFDIGIESVDYKFNPTKGININFIFQGGTRTLDGESAEEDKVEVIVPSDDINNPTISLIPRTSTVFKAQTGIELYIPFFKITTLKIANKTAYIHNPYLFNNDLYRIGGFHLLRGFDEQSIFSSLYSVMTLEYRLLLEQNSFVGLFFDQAYTQKNTFIDSEEDFPFGFGASINFQTKPGVFSIMYAIGRQQNNPINFQSSKIHFGFISLF